MVNSEVNFGALGASAAFPGRAPGSWGSCLVEPPSIGALRRRAGDKLEPLGKVSRPRSGIPTRVVDYFCLEELEDADVLASMGLRSQRDRQRLAVVRDGRGAVHVIERAVLKPMVRRPAALEGKLQVKASDTNPWNMFYVQVSQAELAELRWSYALKYIDYGETQDFPGPEGSRRAGGIPALRPQVRVRPVWFQVPTISLAVGRVCWLKGRGDKHYAPSLDHDVLIPDNFQYSPVPEGLPHPKAFAAISNLSWTHLMAEIYGRRGGGDGVLHTYIRELTMIPIINPTRLSISEAEELAGLFGALSKRSVLPIAEELRQPDRQAFDLWAMRYLFDEDAEDAGRAVERSLRDLAAERQERPASGREQRGRAVRRSTFDPAPVAARLFIDKGVPPTPLNYLDDYRVGGLDSRTVEIPAHKSGPVEAGSTLLDQGDVILDGERLMSAPSDNHADLVVGILTADPSFAGTVYLPADGSAAAQVVHRWEREWSSRVRDVEQTIKETLPRQQHAQRRLAVAREFELRAGVSPNVLSC